MLDFLLHVHLCVTAPPHPIAPECSTREILLGGLRYGMVRLKAGGGGERVLRWAGLQFP